MTRRPATGWLPRVPLGAACIATAVAFGPAALAQDAPADLTSPEQVLAAIASAKARLDAAARQRAALPAETRVVAPVSAAPAVSPPASPIAEPDPSATTDLSATIRKLQALQSRLGDVDLARAVNAPGDPHLQDADAAIRTGLDDLIAVLGQAREDERASGGVVDAETKEGAP